MVEVRIIMESITVYKIWMFIIDNKTIWIVICWYSWVPVICPELYHISYNTHQILICSYSLYPTPHVLSIWIMVTLFALVNVINNKCGTNRNINNICINSFPSITDPIYLEPPWYHLDCSPKVTYVKGCAPTCRVGYFVVLSSKWDINATLLKTPQELCGRRCRKMKKPLRK